jgi:hypothetical protein
MKNLASGLLAAVLPSLIPGHAISQTSDTGKALVPSNVLRASADAERSGGSVAYAFIVPFAGEIRIRWEFKSDGSGATARSEAGGLAYSCEPSTTAATYQRGLCNARVMAGERLLVGVGSLASYRGHIAYIRNVRIYYNVVDNPGTGATLVD